MNLTPAESRIAALLALGHKDREIAERLEWTVGAVKVATCRINRKLGFSKSWGNPRVRLVLWWLKQEKAKSSSASPVA